MAAAMQTLVQFFSAALQTVTSVRLLAMSVARKAHVRDVNIPLLCPSGESNAKPINFHQRKSLFALTIEQDVRSASRGAQPMHTWSSLVP
jgi:hypothetical protein